MRILWKASDGKEFIIDTVKEGLNSQEDVLNHIDKLRKENGYDQPTFMSVEGASDEGQAMVTQMNPVHVDELDPELKEKVNEVIAEGINRLDPRKLN